MNNVTLNESKEYALQRLDKELVNAKLYTLKTLLEDKKINIPDNIETLKELKKYLKKQLTPNEYGAIEQLFTDVDKKFDETINKLKTGSTNAFTKFLHTIEDVLKPLGKGIINTLAIRTAIKLAPTITLKLTLTGLLTLKNVVKLNKTNKYKNIANKSYACNMILKELETSKDVNGNILDTRFDENTIEQIKNFLKTNNIKYIDTGYLSLRDCIYKLPLEKKEALINIINNLKGNNIDVKTQLSKYEKSLLDKFKDNFVKPIVIGGGAGLALATTVNAADPGWLASFYNGTGLKILFDKVINDKTISTISGYVTGTLASFLLKYVPFAGELFENIFAYENIIITSVLGAVGNLGFNTIIRTKDNIKNTMDKAKNNKEIDKIIHIDSEKYHKDILEEIKRRKEYYEINGPEPEEKAIMVLVIRYMEENNIILDKKMNSIEDLKAFIMNLDKKEQKKINKFLNKLEDLRKNNYSYFIKLMNDTKNILYICTSLSLAGISIVDIIKKGELLKQDKIPEIHNELNSKQLFITDGKYYGDINLEDLQTGSDIYNKLYFQAKKNHKGLQELFDQMNINQFQTIYDYMKNSQNIEYDIYYETIEHCLNNKISQVNDLIQKGSIVYDTLAASYLPLEVANAKEFDK